jgi:phage-related protein
MTWNIIVHPKAVLELNKLPVDMRAKLARLLEIIEQVGPFELREPHVKSLGNKLMEIRLSGKDGISRVIYVARTGREVVLLHAFYKKKRPRKRLIQL